MCGNLSEYPPSNLKRRLTAVVTSGISSSLTPECSEQGCIGDRQRSRPVSREPSVPAVVRQPAKLSVSSSCMCDASALRGGVDDTVGDEAIFGIVTVSDRASSGVYEDLSGPAILNFFKEAVKSR